MFSSFQIGSGVNDFTKEGVSFDTLRAFQVDLNISKIYSIISSLSCKISSDSLMNLFKIEWDKLLKDRIYHVYGAYPFRYVFVRYVYLNN